MTAIQKYEELGFTNDFMFSRIMQDQKICKPFLEMILDIKIDHIEYLESQKNNRPQGRCQKCPTGYFRRRWKNGI